MRNFGSDIQAVRPGSEIFMVSSKSSDGVYEYVEFLANRHAQFRASAAAAAK
jgi:Ni2+-binding GTPase involved in maturation of urease and hydrogenase